MKSLFKPFIKRLLFQNQDPKTFIPCRIDPENIRERVILKSGKNETDISQKHSIVCHHPFFVAVCLPAEKYHLYTSGGLRLEIRAAERLDAQATLSYKLKIEAGGDVIVVFEVRKAGCFQLSLILQYILLKRYFLRKKKDSYQEGKIYAALYAYARAVTIVSFRNNACCCIFPIDFQCFIQESNLCLFAIQNTNSALKAILDAKRAAISDTAFADVRTIYALGRNRGAVPRMIDGVPFNTSSSGLFDFPVPSFSACCRELEIVRHVDLGTHTFIIANVANSTRIKDAYAVVHHIHFFQFIRSRYTELLA